MIVVDWHAVLWGLASGAPVSALFFNGLAWGIRRAMVSARPGVVLALSALARMAVLLLVGYGVMLASGTAWSLAGFMVAFFVVRLVAVQWVRVPRPQAAGGEEDTCN